MALTLTPEVTAIAGKYIDLYSGGISTDWPLYGQPTIPLPASAWVDPLGKFYAVRDCGHSGFARDYFGIDTWDAVDVLEAKGWLHISFGAVYHKKNIRQSQFDTLFDILMVYEQTGYKYAGTFRLTFERLQAQMEGEF